MKLHVSFGTLLRHGQHSITTLDFLCGGTERKGRGNMRAANRLNDFVISCTIKKLCREITAFGFHYGCSDITFVLQPTPLGHV